MSGILKEIYSHRDKNRAKASVWYFKTGKGQYGEGDIFWGLTVPISRRIAIKYKDVSLKEIDALIKNKIHEVRLIALFILMYKYKNGSQDGKEKVVKFYLKNTKYINNWDLVDLPCCHILGDYLYNLPLSWAYGNSPKPSLGERDKILMKLANSKNLWEQRIAIVSTLVFVKNGDMKPTLKLAKMFLGHSHDLIHKATGWVLREVGKRNSALLYEFLEKNVSKMPRTTLRYAIERFPENLRKEYLRK
ncbi:MAG: DNA alkylation repair protein [Candidatus Nomurabacteria bacterium]|nr:DNA alkylation repair protein [Candidatus Nomurabacteria bacterium]